MIYICIPAHNEQQTVGVVLWKLRQVLTDFPRDYQLLVADDASTDRTHDVLEPYTRVLPLTVIRSDRKLGNAASLEMLLREAVRRSEYPKRDIVVTLQADFSEEPDDLVPLIKRIEAGADIAIGNKVSKSRPTRIRRFARSLAGMFASGKWPEGVETPFDGYRAYRLHALKRATEESPGRLIRYDGWAAQAELLRHVLPHARRVDAVDVVDRSDRQQRASRENPFAAAMAVRAMSRGTVRAGLVPVEELAAIAASASRSRDRSTAGVREEQAGRAGNGNGVVAGPRGRDRAAAGGRGNDAQRDRNRTRGGRARDVTGEEPRRKAPARSGGSGGSATRGAASAPAKGQKRAPRPPRQPRNAPSPRAAAAATATDAGTLSKATDEALSPPAAIEALQNAALEQEGEAPDSGAPPRKKRRRRRRGSGASRSVTEATEAAAPEAGSDSPADAPGGRPDTGGESPATAPEAGPSAADGSGTAGAEQGTGERKRRRRGGRRGGRGRHRKTPAEGGPDGESGQEDGAPPEPPADTE